jgi:hypothetical protein
MDTLMNTVLTAMDGHMPDHAVNPEAAPRWRGRRGISLSGAGTPQFKEAQHRLVRHDPASCLLGLWNVYDHRFGAK